MRHDAVVGALYHAALVLGVQAVREPKGLGVNQLRPDLRMVFPGQQVLADVVVSHPLTPGFIHKGDSLRMLGVAKDKQTTKRKKYARTAAQHNALMLPFGLETCGGMAPEALRLLKLMGQAGEEHLALWPRGEVVRYLVGAVAMAVQRGTATAYLTAHAKAVAMGSVWGGRRAKDGAEAGEEAEEEEAEEEEEEEEEAEQEAEVEEEAEEDGAEATE
jgi:hypothetical protein